MQTASFQYKPFNQLFDLKNVFIISFDVLVYVRCATVRTGFIVTYAMQKTSQINPRLLEVSKFPLVLFLDPSTNDDKSTTLKNVNNR